MFSGTGLVCAATFEELQTFGIFGQGNAPSEVVEAGRLWRLREGYAAITGVGIPITLLRLIPWLESLKPEWVFNIGIAGAYPDNGWNIGDIALGTSELFADLGMELPGEKNAEKTSEEDLGKNFQPLGSTPFADPLCREPMPLQIPEGLQESDGPLRIRLGKGATVNSCTGSAATGQSRRRIFGVDFETMEGAAVALASSVRGIPLCEVRSISNFASERDMRPENIQKALQSLRFFWELHRRSGS